MTTCDYHDLPVVCGRCGLSFSAQSFADHVAGIPRWCTGILNCYPVHRIHDPEGIEGTAVVPCGEAS